MKGRNVLILVFIVAVFALSPSVMAAILPPNTPEIQSLQTTTGIIAAGIVTENDALSWRLSSELLDTNLDPAVNGPEASENGNWIFIGQDINNAGPEDFEEVNPGEGLFIFPYWPQYPLFAEVPIYTNEPPLNGQEVQMAMAYDETTNALNGVVSYNKNSALHTGTQTLNNYNLKTGKTVTFTALDGGKLTSAENLMLDNVGKSISIIAVPGATTCPFAQGAIGNCTPAFCNIAQAGSLVDIYVGSLVTNTQSRTVGKDSGQDVWPPIPIVDGPPVEMNYGVRLSGYNAGEAAEGDAMAYFKAHKLEGARECPSGFLGAAQEITYNEVTSATGSIRQFQKIINYQSGISLTGCPTCG